ncbi:STAS domain-containing protein [Streptomyces sp. A0592]|uniref:STAS domain-containing protein n=1 Tax=Streptomyces sp. A0592 TaxID=2563099 RepID=UPI00109E7EEE|nr:STAS domain-containing protein [Streptomyces sp. A0592]THA78697.1 anti-sigma factor antagonist [Streptomyces sp. A0592]
MDDVFQIMVQRFGPTMHVALAGELDLDTRTTLGDITAALESLLDVDVVVCDMHGLTFCDVTGLHGLVTLAGRLHRWRIAFFTYGWQPQPLRLLDLVDSTHQPASPHPAPGTEPTALLRRTLSQAAGASREAGARTVRARSVLSQQGRDSRPVRGSGSGEFAHAQLFDDVGALLTPSLRPARRTAICRFAACIRTPGHVR